ncbi:MAG: NF038129 family PEP-CTERM protein [Bryobacteraceae bacterium]
MFLMGTRASKLGFLAASILGFFILPAHAALVYEVTVDTSSINGVNGVIDLQFNPGGLTSQAASALVTSFNAGGGTLGSVVPPVGGPVTGSLLTDDLAFQNSANTDYAHELLFADFVQFLVTFDGLALNSPDNGPAGTSFGVFLYDQTFNPLVTADALVAQIDINPDGTITTTGFPLGSPVVTFNLITSDVPEPGTLTSLLLAGCALSLYARKRAARF